MVLSVSSKSFAVTEEISHYVVRLSDTMER